MKIISELSDLIEEELHDAEKYIRKALNTKEDYPAVASTYYKLSLEEMNHVAALHEQVVVAIADYRKLYGDPPERMQDRYDYIHNKHIEKANEIKIIQALYKG